MNESRKQGARPRKADERQSKVYHHHNYESNQNIDLKITTILCLAHKYQLENNHNPLQSPQVSIL